MRAALRVLVDAQHSLRAAVGLQLRGIGTLSAAFHFRSFCLEIMTAYRIASELPLSMIKQI